jgi:glycosyltransferase involved in cell wall biosynthesis
MKIVYFIDHLRPDGTQTVLRQLVQGLAKRGHQQAVICLNDSWDVRLSDELRSYGAEVQIIGKPALLSGVGAIRILRWLRQERFDVAVTLLFFADVIGRSLARLARVPRVISSVQNANDHYPWWQRLVARRIATWADVIISCSASVREISIRVEGLPPNRVVVIPNGLDWTAYTKPLACEALAALFGIPLGAVMLGNVGRLTYQKGQDVLLQALAATGRPNLHLIIAGMGECETALREQAQRLGITGRVHFVGHRRDLPQLLGALDLYVHASRFEGMPIAVLEAMAAGCPIVATAVNGICEIIEDGLQGWLVPTEDPAALATTIRRALDDPAEGRRRGDRARERVREQFSEEAMVRAWEHVLTRDPD